MSAQPVNGSPSTESYSSKLSADIAALRIEIPSSSPSEPTTPLNPSRVTHALVQDTYYFDQQTQSIYYACMVPTQGMVLLPVSAPQYLHNAPRHPSQTTVGPALQYAAAQGSAQVYVTPGQSQPQQNGGAAAQVAVVTQPQTQYQSSVQEHNAKLVGVSDPSHGVGYQSANAAPPAVQQPSSVMQMHPQYAAAGFQQHMSATGYVPQLAHQPQPYYHNGNGAPQPQWYSPNGAAGLPYQNGGAFGYGAASHFHSNGGGAAGGQAPQSRLRVKNAAAGPSHNTAALAKQKLQQQEREVKQVYAAPSAVAKKFSPVIGPQPQPVQMPQFSANNGRALVLPELLLGHSETSPFKAVQHGASQAKRGAATTRKADKVCKYFLQNRCYFGDKCRFKHGEK